MPRHRARGTVEGEAVESDAKERISNALVRNAQLDANHIVVTVIGNSVTLSGHVRSWAEKEQAGRAAWASPHITDVQNNVRVQSD